MTHIWIHIRNSYLHVLRDVTSFINRAAILGFFADAYFLTSADHPWIFLDLEPCCKSHAADACRPPLGDCSATARFALQMTKFLADVPMTIGRRPSGDCRDTCPSPLDNNKSYDHRQVAVWASCGHLWVRNG